MIRHALLALLGAGADHGYRLKRRFDELLGPVWQVNVGQVYQALEQLRRARWVEELPPETDRGGGHERWPVAITPTGVAELARWLEHPIAPSQPPPPPRSELLGRLAVGGWACVERVLADIEAERGSYLSARERIEQEKARLRDLDTPADVAGFLALEASSLQIDAHVTWLERCHERLSRARPAPGAVLPNPARKARGSRWARGRISRRATPPLVRG